MVELADVPAVSALETDFPAEEISYLAEQESWRKEIHRPATHTHKWWAQRLGTVFRAILLSATTPDREAALRAFSGLTRLVGLTVYDPFAGSGTTLAEAAKLGATVIGRDINPVATLVQRQALQVWDEGHLRVGLKAVAEVCKADIDALHSSSADEPVLYYFWVAVAPCSTCQSDVDLFSTYVFARHAYAKRFPAAQATCPDCNDIVAIDLSEDSTFACRAGHQNRLLGPVRGQMMTCPRGHQSRAVDALGWRRPSYRMYAKLVLRADGAKEYRSVDIFDLELYEKAKTLLRDEADRLVLPSGALEDGYNTRQAMRWGFVEWSHFFNARQLYCLGRLAAAIRDLEVRPAEREALATLFSGILEFNNLFCSFKGEGTGAVRHMFSHHVLKPERVPLEAHPWGTPASSGSFSTLFESRLVRALEYKENPHDLILEASKPVRVYGLSAPLRLNFARNFHKSGSSAELAYVTCGDASHTDLPHRSVDLIITDPPFMDNVHYSELADFFHSWLREIVPFASYPIDPPTTRQAGEVQSTSSEQFEAAIASVWRECHRVLRDEGLLAFTFHQARSSGWLALMRALKDAGFMVTAVQPVKAEMSTSVTKAAP
ncbi:MAG: DNA methyltransferase, partial [Actinomycetota bacterium]